MRRELVVACNAFDIPADILASADFPHFQLVPTGKNQSCGAVTNARPRHCRTGIMVAVGPPGPQHPMTPLVARPDPNFSYCRF